MSFLRHYYFFVTFTALLITTTTTKMKNLLVIFSVFILLNSYSQINPPLSAPSAQLGTQLNAELAHKWNQESFGSFDYQREDISLRDRSAKHFKNSDGTYTAFIGAGYVHYWEDQQWKTIYHQIDKKPSSFQNLTNQHKTYYPINSDGELRTILPDGNELKEMKNMRMYFEVNGVVTNEANIASKEGSSEFNLLNYKNIYGAGIDLRLTQETTKRKMDYIISDLANLGTIPAGADYLIFEEDVELPAGWTAIHQDSLIVIKDNNGLVKLVYDKPMFHDTPQPDQHGHAHRHEHNGDYAISQSGNTVTIQTKVPMSWLLDADLEFPVTIDPTINLYPNNTTWWTGSLDAYHSNPSSAADAPIYSASAFDAGYNDEIFLGRFSTYYSAQSWAKFNISSLPSACVNSASLNYRVLDNYSNSSDCRVNGRLRHLASDPVTNSWTGRLNDIRDGDIYQTFDFTCFNTGGGGSWVNVPMTANLDEIENAQPSGWFGVGFHTFEGGPHTTCYTEIYGYSSASRPYLTIDYRPNYQVQFSNFSPTELCAGQTKDISVTITNSGCLPWTSGWTPPNSVNFSWWGNWQTGQDSNPRITPFTALASGASQTVTFSVTAPAAPGAYTIQTDLVRDGVCWFRGNGAPNCGPGNVNYVIPITVLPSAASPTAINPANPTYCIGNTVDLTSTGGTAASGNIVDVWYENSCNIGLEETWRTSPVRPGWWIANSTVNSANGVLNVSSTGNDAMIYMGNLNIDPNIYRYVQVRYRYVSGPTNPGMQVFFDNGSVLAEARSQRGVMNMDGNWHYLNLDMSINYSNANSGWVGGPNITALRFDFCEQSGMEMEFDFFLVSEDRMVSDQANLVINEGDPDYPTSPTTDYYTRKIDDCGATSCVSTTVSFPPVSGFLSINGESASCVVDENGWVQFYNHTSGRLLCAINSFGQNLGTVTATSYVQTPPFQVDACLFPQPEYNTATLGRRWVITPQFQPTTPVDVRLYYDNPEYIALSPVANSNQNIYDNTASYADLVLSKYHNTVNPPLVNSSPFDNCPSGATTLYSPNAANTASSVITGFDPNGRYNEYSIPTFSEFWLHGSSNASPLPVELTEFNAICIENGIALSWTTASEINSDYFAVERSRDGINWVTAGILNAAGNASSENNYSYTDNDNDWDNSYYRLRQVDMDGSSVFYGPISAACNNTTSTLSVYPNPTSNNFTVNVNSAYIITAAEMSIQNNQGRVIWSKLIHLEKGSNNFNFDQLQLESGTYIISLNSSKEQLKPVKLVIY